jgi:glycosyltransferase involved in cell wall biosynthesis
MTVLHLLWSAPPDVTGASIRSRYLVESQARLGVSPVVLSSPFQAPFDPACARGVERLNGIPYHRCFDSRDHGEFMAAHKPLSQRLGKLVALPAFVRRARRVALDERAQLIHGHSLFFCGLASGLAARSLGMPSLYEVRSLIEEGLVAQGGITTRSPLYRAYRIFEALSLRLATHVTTISEGLRRDLIERGVAPGKITVVGNGVDVERQRPAGPRDARVLERLGFPADALVVGYIGTLFTYESLDLLVDATALLAPTMPSLRVVLVGDGDAARELRGRVERRGLGKVVAFTGRLPHDAVGDYYAAVDLFVLPRRANRLTDLVTPLKPLEIMARGKAILASDCGGHLEIVRDGLNARTFTSGSVDDLAARMRELLARPQELAALGRQAREWVARNRSWDAMVRPVVDCYARLLGRADSSALADVRRRQCG